MRGLLPPSVTIIVLPETGSDESLRKAEALCSHMATRPLLGEYAITISCGVASVAAGDTTDSLFQRADVALYAAKRQGRNQAMSAGKKTPSSFNPGLG